MRKEVIDVCQASKLIKIPCIFLNFVMFEESVGFLTLVTFKLLF